MRNIKFASVVALLLAAGTTWAGDEASMIEKPSFSASQSMTVSALVEAINHETRVVTVRKPDGEAITFTADDEVRNLAQVNVGDFLIAEYVETVSVEVMANAGLEPEEAEASAMTKPEDIGKLYRALWDGADEIGCPRPGINIVDVEAEEFYTYGGWTNDNR